MKLSLQIHPIHGTLRFLFPGGKKVHGRHVAGDACIDR